METEGTSRRISVGLIILGAATLVGLLSFPYSRLVAALLPLVGALVLLLAKPVGNRLMVFGIAVLSGLLLVALWWFEVFFLMLDVLAAIILMGAGVLKHRGKW